MLNKLRKSKVLVCILVFLNVSTLIANSPIQSDTENIKEQSYFAGKEGKIFDSLFDEDGTPIFERFCCLFNEIESEIIDNVCTEKDWHEINRFLFYLGKKGFLPGSTKEENEEIQNDANELFFETYFNNLPDEHDPESYYLNYEHNHFMIIPAAYYGEEKIFKTKNCFKKSCKSVKKFVKKHKTAIIATTTVILVGGVTAAVVINSKSSSNDSVPVNSDISRSNNTSKNFPNSPSYGNDNIIQEDIWDKQIDLAKDIVDRNSKIFTDNLSIDRSEENARIIGYSLGHELIRLEQSNISSQYSAFEYEKKLHPLMIG